MRRLRWWRDNHEVGKQPGKHLDPSANSFYEVEKVPILGTGKLDLAAVKQMARSLS